MARRLKCRRCGYETYSRSVMQSNLSDNRKCDRYDRACCLANVDGIEEPDVCRRCGASLPAGSEVYLSPGGGWHCRRCHVPDGTTIVCSPGEEIPV